VGGGRLEWVDLATNQVQLPFSDHHIAVGQLHLAVAHGFDFPALQHHARFKALFKKIVISRFFIVGNARGGVGFFSHEII
jgi:hypothetical protein